MLEPVATPRHTPIQEQRSRGLATTGRGTSDRRGTSSADAKKRFDRRRILTPGYEIFSGR
jgi:hypothetical protein